MIGKNLKIYIQFLSSSLNSNKTTVINIEWLNLSP